MVGCQDHEVGQSPDEWLSRIHPEDRPQVEREIDAHLHGGSAEFIIQHRMRYGDGSYRWMRCHAAIVRDDEGRPTRMMGCLADVTADRVADVATGLPNRLLFHDRLQHAIDLSRHDAERSFAVLVLGLDRRSAGSDGDRSAGPDLLLAAVARRLETSLRPSDAPATQGRDYLVARLGGDEFGILIEGQVDVGEARVSAQRILAAVEAPLSPDVHETLVQVSIGIAVSVTGYHRAEVVLRDADAALHRAKALGGGRCELFDTTLLDTVRSRLELEAELEKALDRQELVLFYQPIVSLATNRIAGFESLLRWQHPTRGLLGPLDFLPLAEETGAIVRIGAWVLREACRQLADWRRQLSIPPTVWMSVNLSSVQFRDPMLFVLVGTAVRDAGLDPRCLMVEVTEGTVMENPAAARGLIMQLRVMGVKVGLDDFGTGHSALAYLHQFPADFLKVDRSFVRSLEARQDVADIVRTVNDLASRLDLEVIAEGIERPEQLALVRSLRCGYVQGFLLARPQDRDRTADLIASGLALPVTIEAGAEPGAREVLDQEPAATPPRPVWRSLAAAMATVVVLVSLGVVVRVVLQPAPNAGPRAQTTDAGEARPGPRVAPVAPPTNPDLAPPARPSVAAPAPVPGGSAANATMARRENTLNASTGRGKATETAARADLTAVVGPAAELFQVVHLHAFGSCTGQLIVTPAGLSFAPDKGKDAFTLPHQAFLVSVADGALVVRSERRTYRFKLPGAAAAEGGASLEKILDSIRRQGR